MQLPTYPLASTRCPSFALLTTLGWLAFISTSSASPASESPEETIERLTGFSDVEITKVSPHKIHIRHHEGGKTLSFDELPESLRKQFGMTADTAKLAEKSEQIARKENARQLAKNNFLTHEAIQVSGVVIQVLETGVLVAEGIVYTDITQPIIVEKQICVDGPTALNPNRAHRFRRMITDETAMLLLELPSLVFIQTPTENFFDGASIEATIWHHGNHRVFLDEQTLTVPAFTINGDQAWRLKNSD